MKTILALLAVAPLFAMSNKVTLCDGATVAHVGEPYTVSRVFAQGEFPAGTYPQPYVSGVAAPLWQADILNNWEDGSYRQVLVTFFASITASACIDVDFRPNASSSSGGSALDKAGMLAFNGGAWGAKIQGTASGIVKSASALTILGAVSECPAGTWTSNGCYKYRMSGPAATQIVLFGGTDNSFGWECDASLSTCPAVSPYTATVWKDPSGSQFNSIHPVFVLTFYTGWAGVKEEMILENTWRGRLQDLKFDLEMLNGSAEANSVYTRAGTVFYALRRAREVFWDGTAPAGWINQYVPGTRIDYNRQYLLYSHAIPFLAPEINVLGVAGTYDLNSTAGNLDIVHNIGTATEAQWCESGGAQCGPQAYSFPSGGSKPELGIVARSYSRFLVSFSSDLYNAMLQIGVMAGAFPFHVRESTTGLTYTVGSAVDAFGKPYSLDARPLQRLAKFQGGTPAGTKIEYGDGVVGTIACLDSTRPYTIGCTVTDAAQSFNRWTVDDAHSPRAAYIPFVITGDWYLEEEQMFGATQALAVEATGSAVAPGCTSNFERHGEAGAGNDWGIPAASHNIRVEAWGTVHVGQTVISLADGSPEKIYYNSRLQKIVDVRRGMFGITPDPADYNPGGSAGDPCPSGTYSAATATPWCWGFVSRMERKANAMALTSIQGTYPGWGLNSAISACASNMWFEHYMRAVYGWLNDAGLSRFEPMVALMSKSLIRQSIQSNAKGATMADYSTIMRLVSTGNPVQSVAEITSAVYPSTTLRAGITSSDTVIPVNNQFVSVNCSATNAVWTGGLTKFVIDVGTASEEYVEALSQPTCQAPGTYTITISRRGVMGTPAVAHLSGAVMARTYIDYGSTADLVMDAGYANIANAAFAYAYPYTTTDEVTGAPLSGRLAWNHHASLIYYQDFTTNLTCVATGLTPKDCQNLMWAFRPRHQITNVRNAPTSSSVRFWYTAPTGNACTYAVSTTAFTNSDSTGDTTTGGASLSRTFTASGLASGTLYYYRITCGPFGGTARTSGTFTTP